MAFADREAKDMAGALLRKFAFMADSDYASIKKGKGFRIPDWRCRGHVGGSVEERADDAADEAAAVHKVSACW